MSQIVSNKEPKKTKLMKVLSIILLIISVGITLYAANTIIGNGIYKWHIKQPPFISMMIEIVILFIVFLSIAFLIPKIKTKLITGIAIFLFFCWGHQILVPIITIIMYTISLFIIGYLLRTRVIKVSIQRNWILNFLLSIPVVIIGISLMSLVNIATLFNIKIVYIILVLVSVAILRKELVLDARELMRNIKSILQDTNKIDMIFYCGILVFIMIQIGRAAIQGDYDSGWYGLRSENIFNAGKGIFENLGTVGFTYVYPKGLETLMLPISGFDSFSFVFCFNISLSVLVLTVTYSICREFISRQKALFLVLVMSSIPGIMNMSITAKTDIITLLVMMMAVFFISKYAITREGIYFWSCISTLILCFTFKITSLFLCSFMLAITLILVIIKNNYNIKCLKLNIQNFMIVVLSLISLFFMCLRTYIITGFPFFKVSSDIFEKIGFSAKFPFEAATNILQSSPPLTLDFVSSRIFRFFFSPTGDDLQRTIMTWGTPAIIFIIITCLILGICGRKEKNIENREAFSFISILMIITCIPLVIGLLKLSMLDGNYFMFLYVAIIIVGGINILSIQKWEKVLVLIFIPILAFNLVLTSVSNWSWKLGFTPFKIINSGYYNNIKEEEVLNKEYLGEDIWKEISSEPKKKLLGIGDVGRVYSFPCIREHITDIISWASPMILDSYDNFKKYLEVTQKDLIFVEKGYISNGEKYSEYIIRLTEEKFFSDIIENKGNFLFKVNTKKDFITTSKYDQVIAKIKEGVVSNDFIHTTKVKGYYSDGWVERSSEFIIKTGQQGVINISGYNPNKYKGDEVLTILVNDKKVMDYSPKDSIFVIELKTGQINEKVNIKINANFSFKPDNGDQRELSFVLTDMQGE